MYFLARMPKASRVLNARAACMLAPTCWCRCRCSAFAFLLLLLSAPGGRQAAPPRAFGSRLRSCGEKRADRGRLPLRLLPPAAAPRCGRCCRYCCRFRRRRRRLRRRGGARGVRSDSCCCSCCAAASSSTPTTTTTSTASWPPRLAGPWPAIGRRSYHCGHCCRCYRSYPWSSSPGPGYGPRPPARWGGCSEQLKLPKGRPKASHLSVGSCEPRGARRA
jgi:hypothetical protein